MSEEENGGVGLTEVKEEQNMPATLTFQKIVNGTIFQGQFNEMMTNNTISFDRPVAVVYAPNGTGKTSFAKVLSGKDKGTAVAFTYDGQPYTKPDGVFHIINDQNSRNIIEGDTQDFVLGDNIRREIELAKAITTEYEGKGTGTIDRAVECLKRHNITAAASLIIPFAGMAGEGSAEFVALLKDIANKQTRAKGRFEDFIRIVSSVEVIDLFSGIEPEKLRFIEEQYSLKSPWIPLLENLCEQLHPLPAVRVVEENTAAIGILERFRSDCCVVCDTAGIDAVALLSRKKERKETIFQELSDNERKIVQGIMDIMPTNDPLGIKEMLYAALVDGNAAEITTLCSLIEQYKAAIGMQIKAEFKTLLTESQLCALNDEYQSLLHSDLNLTDEDEFFIQQIISGSMGRDLKVERIEGNALRITIGGQPLLNEAREKLHLSSGEQNFLSLAFEFLKARKSPCPIIVLDDPISSFDSIYKNKTAFTILKFLEGKNRIVLTHNIDLLRLLDVQLSDCYNLYILNNAADENVGFIPLSQQEKGMAIYLDKLLRVFRRDIFPCIMNHEQFLLSMIPFMRGYANVIDNEDIYTELCKVMHGYETGSVDLAAIYRTLFEKPGFTIPAPFPEHFEVSVAEILSEHLGNSQILDQTQYPLLNKTLRHSLMYLYLRLLTEKRLMDKFDMPHGQGGILQLGTIINRAFSQDPKSRATLNSKKTLMNEFNHFEGNLSIFMPAMDITDSMLNKEKDDILDFLNSHCLEQEIADIGTL